MSEVTLSVAGRNYTIACGPGEEETVRRLAGEVERRLIKIGATLNSPTEGRNLLLASLMLADELEDSKTRPASSAESDIAQNLETLAERLEKTATLLESG